MLPDIEPKESLPDDWVWQRPLIAILGGVIVICLFCAIAMAIVMARG